MAASSHRTRGEGHRSSPKRRIPSVYDDDFDDGDTRLDPRALIGDGLISGPRVRTSGATVVMAAARSPMPAARSPMPAAGRPMPAARSPLPIAVIAARPALPAPSASPAFASSAFASSGPSAQRHEHARAPSRAITGLEIAGASAVLVTVGVVIAILALYFSG